jgi:hypothetical protein
LTFTTNVPLEGDLRGGGWACVGALAAAAAVAGAAATAGAGGVAARAGAACSIGGAAAGKVASSDICVAPRAVCCEPCAESRAAKASGNASHDAGASPLGVVVAKMAGAKMALGWAVSTDASGNAVESESGVAKVALAKMAW